LFSLRVSIFANPQRQPPALGAAEKRYAAVALAQQRQSRTRHGLPTLSAWRAKWLSWSIRSVRIAAGM
jgi:hypothetical protein